MLVVFGVETALQSHACFLFGCGCFQSGEERGRLFDVVQFRSQCQKLFALVHNIGKIHRYGRVL